MRDPTVPVAITHFADEGIIDIAFSRDLQPLSTSLSNNFTGTIVISGASVPFTGAEGVDRTMSNVVEVADLSPLFPNGPIVPSVCSYNGGLVDLKDVDGFVIEAFVNFPISEL